MKNKVKLLLLTCIICVFFAIPAMATSLSDFDYQNQNHYRAVLTSGIQTMLYYYDKTSRARLGSDGIDGSYGPKTAEAVSYFQKKKGIGVDGSCGPETWRTFDSCLVEMSKTEQFYYYKMNDYYSTKCMRLNRGSGIWYAYYNGGYQFMGAPNYGAGWGD